MSVKFSGFKPASTYVGTDKLVGLQSGVNTIGSLDQVAAYVNPKAPVQSVAGKTGDVTLAESDIASLPADLASKLALSGGTMTGNLILNADATLPLQAVALEQLTAAIVNAGTGLTKSGNTLSITSTGVSGSGAGSASSVPVITYNTQGQLFSAVDTPIQIPESAVTNLPVDLANKQPLNALLTSLSGIGTAPVGRLYKTGATSTHVGDGIPFSGTAFNNITNNANAGDEFDFTSASAKTAALDITGLGAGFEFFITNSGAGAINFTSVSGSIYGLTSVAGATSAANTPFINVSVKDIGGVAAWYVQSAINPATVCKTANNLSDVANSVTALTNLGVIGVHSWKPSLIFGSQNNGAIFEVMESGATNKNNFAGWLFPQAQTSYLHLRGMIPKSINTSVNAVEISISCKTASTTTSEAGVFNIQAVNHLPGAVEDQAFSVPTVIGVNPVANAYGTIITSRIDIVPDNSMSWPEELEIRIYRVAGSGGDTLSQPIFITDIDVVILTAAGNDA